MFTGIVEAIGTVKTAQPKGGGLKLSIDIAGLASQVKLGDSVAVNGLCLTTTKIQAGVIDFDVSGESINKTTVSQTKAGDKVNVELAMQAGGRFGGHIMQGHIDGTASVRSIDKKGDYWDITFAADKELLDDMVVKGSVAVSGISLTIARMDNSSFTVAIIPTTVSATVLKDIKIGDKVNIETDVICKMVKKQLKQILPDGAGRMTIDKLKEMGF